MPTAVRQLRPPRDNGWEKGARICQALGHSCHIGHTCVGSWPFVWHTMGALECDLLYQLETHTTSSERHTATVAWGWATYLLSALPEQPSGPLSSHPLPSPEQRRRESPPLQGIRLHHGPAMCSPHGKVGCEMTRKQTWPLMRKYSSDTQDLFLTDSP